MAAMASAPAIAPAHTLTDVSAIPETHASTTAEAFGAPRALSLLNDSGAGDATCRPCSARFGSHAALAEHLRSPQHASRMVDGPASPVRAKGGKRGVSSPSRSPARSPVGASTEAAVGGRKAAVLHWRAAQEHAASRRLREAVGALLQMIQIAAIPSDGWPDKERAEMSARAHLVACRLLHAVRPAECALLAAAGVLPRYFSGALAASYEALFATAATGAPAELFACAEPLAAKLARRAIKAASSGAGADPTHALSDELLEVCALCNATGPSPHGVALLALLLHLDTRPLAADRLRDGLAQAYELTRRPHCAADIYADAAESLKSSDARAALRLTAVAVVRCAAADDVVRCAALADRVDALSAASPRVARFYAALARSVADREAHVRRAAHAHWALLAADVASLPGGADLVEQTAHLLAA